MSSRSVIHDLTNGRFRDGNTTNLNDMIGGFIRNSLSQSELEGEANLRIFAGGRWMCSGKTVALFDLNKVTFELMRRFDFQVADPVHAWRVADYLMPYVSEMMVCITEDTSM
ncbi:hypothetical protein B0T14DRAFT_561468 [Immersiella caudata]|uniref:Cytochrome P450 n=1 Tax=Immersiella caudata TaxID=314043 RepID=A0AA39XH64_9PEZI|nr:hypothetical protein B0T14DRAFT_561468 [Immersiella caudata]